MTEKPFLALFAAAAVECSNWIRFRWNFDNQATSQALRITLALTLITGILVWLDGDRYTALPALLKWLPLLLLPVQFVQSFGIRNYLNLNAFSLFSKFHRKRNEALGLTLSVIRFNFGNFYFIAIIVAATLGRFAQHPIFFPGLIILVGWLIYSRIRNRVFALLSVLAMSALIGFGGQLGMSKLYKWATSYSMDGGGFANINPTFNKTSIGSLGELKQSTAMLWRLTPEPGEIPPKLIRTATYNHYKGIIWRNDIPVSDGDDETNFRELSTMELEQGNPFYLLRENMTRQDLTKDLPSFRMRGAAKPEETIPLPGNSSSLAGFELDGIEINPLGTVLIFPRKPIIDGSVRWNDSQEPDARPFPEEDLVIDPYEFEGIHEVADSIGLKQLPTTAAKVRRIKEFFLTEFTYTRYLSIPRARSHNKPPTEIGAFLTTSKRGHCEYFATAATLLLRASDVPSRYCVGFSVMEKNPKKNEWIIRGTHGHAWTRYWDQSSRQWIDFDATPPSWPSVEAGGKADRFQWLNDAYQRFKEDFFLWRNQPRNRLISSIVMWILGLAVVLFVSRRLWKSKLSQKQSKRESFYHNGSLSVTPLHQLEKRAQKILGPRSPGETFVSWLTRLKDHGVSEARLRQASELHQQLRFDPSPDQSKLTENLGQIVKELKNQLKTR
jgi:hypothetical protein